jgi:hypothetical protein
LDNVEGDKRYHQRNNHGGYDSCQGLPSKKPSPKSLRLLGL